MAYCDQDDILEQVDSETVIQLTDDSDVGVIDESIVTRAIERADAEINAHCQGRYDIPLDPVPDIIRDKSTDIAIYHLHSRRGDPPANVVERYKIAIRFLEKIATGGIQLGTATPAVTSTGSPVRVTTDKDDRVFTMTTMEGF